MRQLVITGTGTPIARMARHAQGQALRNNRNTLVMRHLRCSWAMQGQLFSCLLSADCSDDTSQFCQCYPWHLWD